MACYQPITVYNRKVHRALLVPCNKCSGCLERKRNTWAHRVEQEKLHGEFKNSFFITLSYDDEFLPYESFSRISKNKRIGEVEPTGEALLNPYDLSMFLKRFRTYSGERICYFACGEYGDPSKTKRPHFHIILFTNLNWQDTLHYTRCAWSRLRPETPQERYQRYKKSKLQGRLIKRDGMNMNNRISFGRDQVRSVNSKRIFYVTKYVQKLFTEETVPPFYRCSNGIGKCFLDSDTAGYLKEYNRHFTYFANGLPVALSRYYTSKLFNSVQMDQFNMSISEITSPPWEFLDNPEELRKWSEYQCILTKQKRIRNNFRYYGVPKC